MINLLVEKRYDTNGNLVYEEYNDGYFEVSEYNKQNQLMRSECHFTNGIVEVEKFNR